MKIVLSKSFKKEYVLYKPNFYEKKETINQTMYLFHSVIV